MNAASEELSIRKQALVVRCAAQRIELQDCVRSLGHTSFPGGHPRKPSSGSSMRRAAFALLLAIAGARKLAAMMAIASQVLVLARLYASLREATRRRATPPVPTSGEPEG